MSRVQPERIPVESADGHRYALEVFPTDGAQRVALLLPAMGVTATYYRAFVDTLTELGSAVAIADWRGHGQSDTRARRGLDWGYRELAEVDLPATLDAARARLGALPMYIVGHSLGGQVACLYAAAKPGELAGIALVASCSVFYKGWGFPRSLGTLTFTQLVGLTSRMLGYFPGERLRFAGLEGRQQMIDWANNARNGRWEIGGSAHDYEDLLAKVETPVLAMSFEGDAYAPSAAVDNQLAKMPRANVTRHHWTAADMDRPGLDHLRWARHSRPIAELIGRWMDSTTAPISNVATMIYHIASAAEWAARADTYAPQGWRDEGFIHCSTNEQVGRVANHHFLGRQDLVLLRIDPAKLEALVVWEDTADAGEDFPHVYGVIDTAAVVSAEPFAAGDDGTFDAWRASD